MPTQSSNAPDRLRSLIGDGTVVAPFVWDGAQARYATAAGHPAVYMTGFGTAAALTVSRTGALQPTIDPALRAVALWSAVSIAASALVVLTWGQRGRSA